MVEDTATSEMVGRFLLSRLNNKLPYDKFDTKFAIGYPAAISLGSFLVSFSLQSAVSGKKAVL